MTEPAEAARADHGAFTADDYQQARDAAYTRHKQRMAPVRGRG